jgi:hypothetical protein
MKKYIQFLLMFLLLGIVISCEEEEENINIDELAAVWELDKFIDKNNNTFDAPAIQISFLENKGITVFTSYNYGQGEFSIKGKKVTVSNLALTDREYGQEDDNRFVSNLTGTYLINGDTLKIKSDYDFDMVLHKTQITDPYQGDLSVLLIDTVETDRYYPEDIFNDEYSSIYGKWFAYFEDNGWGEVAPRYDFYEFKENGIYCISKGFNLLEYGRTDLIRTTSEGYIVLKLIPFDNTNPQLLYDRSFKFQGKDTIVIGGPCVGCTERLCRVK